MLTNLGKERPFRDHFIHLVVLQLEENNVDPERLVSFSCIMTKIHESEQTGPKFLYPDIAK